jgi:hypothetical protein
MPWNPELLAAASQGLRNAVAHGNFVPSEWVNAIDLSDDDGGGCYGCGWGIVAWSVAMEHGGLEYAIDKLPIGCTQTQVNEVLKDVGLTRAEIKLMDPQETWAHFDSTIAEAFAERAEYPGSFRDVSCDAALYFVGVLNRVPVAAFATAKVFCLSPYNGQDSEVPELNALAA